MADEPLSDSRWYRCPECGDFTERAVDRTRLEMVHALHRALFGEMFARPQSPADVWAEMLERIERARRQFLR